MLVAPNIFKPRIDWNIVALNAKKSHSSIEARIADIVRNETGRDPLISSASRKGPVCQTRQLYMAMLVRHTPKTLQSISSGAGKKTHGTVLNAVKSIDNLRDTNREFRELYNRINKLIETTLK